MRKRGCWIALAALAVLVAGFLFTGPGQAFLDIWRTGAIQDAMQEPKRHDYEADSSGNLKAIYTALKLYHDSEGQLPNAAGWMDAIEKRINTSDLKKGEAEKKLIRPDLLGQAGAFGYAMSDAASGKYMDDLKDKTAPLIYESKQTARNAHGDPKTDGKGSYIAVDGSIHRF